MHEQPEDDQPRIRVRLLRAGAKLPFRATEDASGYDVYASIEGRPLALSQRPTMVGTGIAMEIPRGYDLQVRPRSGLASKGILSTFGTVDADYRGELKVVLYTTAPGIEHTIHDGDRIAQLVVARLVTPAFVEADALSATERGEGGHGSTGR